jgi:hypothetical protein
VPQEIYANDSTTTVTTGGTGTPGTETWTVASSASFPAASNSATPPTQFHVADPALPSELMTVTNVSGTTWSVTRGAEGTTAVAHTAGFTVRQVVSSGALVALRDRVPWLNVATIFGADRSGAVDATTAINNAITAAAGAGVVYLPAGTYKLTAALTLGSGVTLRGDGPAATILNQTGTAANGITITGTTVANVQVCDLRLNGPNSGTGAGITAAANAGANPVVQLVLRNLIVYQFGSHGLALQNTIVSLLDNIQAVNNLARGFYLLNGTSTTLLNCYANTNPNERGYYLSSLLYSSLVSCASDGNAIGYELFQCDNVSMLNCGAEDTAAGTSGLDGSSYKINACTATALRGGRALNNAATGCYFTGSSAQCSLDGFTETAAGGATASIKIDTGCSVSAANYVAATAESFASGTVSIISNFGYTFLPTLEVGAGLSVDNFSTFFDQGSPPAAPTGGASAYSAAGDLKYVSADSNAYSTGRLTLAPTSSQTFTLASAVAITGMSCALGVGVYMLHMRLWYTPSGTIASTHTPSLAFTGTAALVGNAVNWQAESSATATAQITHSPLTGAPGSLGVSVTHATFPGWMEFDGVVTVTVAGTLSTTITLTTAGDNIVLAAGSYLEVLPIS